MSFIIIYITYPNESEAEHISNHLITNKLVACANIFPISSTYWWQGDIQRENEWVSIVKTTPENWKIVKDTIEKIHPYDVPCIMKMEVKANVAYENWIRESVQ